jgi:hypothetical protein
MFRVPISYDCYGLVLSPDVGQDYQTLRTVVRETYVCKPLTTIKISI